MRPTVIEGVRIDASGSLSLGELARTQVRAALARNDAVVLRGVISATDAAGIRSMACSAADSSVARVQDDLSGATFGPRRLCDVILGAEQSRPVAVHAALHELRHRVAGAGPPAPPNVDHAVVVHYPRGGGQIDWHRDRDEEVFVVMLLFLSSLGDGYSEGGVAMRRNGRVLHLEGLIATGDVLLLRASVEHKVFPVDPSAENYRFGEESGRWVMNPTHHLQVGQSAWRGAAAELWPLPVEVESEQMPCDVSRAWLQLLQLRVGEEICGATLRKASGHELLLALPDGAPLELRLDVAGSPAFVTSGGFGFSHRGELTSDGERCLRDLASLTAAAASESH